MSYEHCEEHDLDATNGCPRCDARALVKKAFEATYDLLDRDLELPKPPPASGLLRKLLAVAYLRGLGLLSSENADVVDAVRLELERYGG